MRRKFIMERASTLSISNTEGKPFIVSSAKAELPKMALAAFGCTSCKAEFSSNKTLKPFCVNCGSNEVKPITAKVQSLPATDAALCSIGCRACGTNNVLSSVTATTLDGEMHCVECGGQLSYDADDLDRPVEDADAADIDNTMSGEQSTTISGDDRGGMTDDSPITDADADDIADALPTTALAASKGAKPAAAVAATEPTENVIPAAPTGEAPVKNVPTSPTTAPTTELDEESLIEHATAADGDTEDDGSEFDADEQEAACEYTTASLAAVVLAKNPKAALTLATSDEEILAFADGVPVARLEKSKAKPEHSAVFHTRPFTQSIERVAADKGLRAALSAYGFSPIKVDFPLGAANRTLAAASLREATTKLQEVSSNHKQDFMQCLSLAATSLNKNLYKKRHSVLKAGFIELLSGAGVTGAKTMVERVFAASGDAYHTQLLELAQELQLKSVDFRNTLSESLSDMNVVDATDYEGAPNDETQEVVVETASALDRQMESAAFAAAKSSASVVKRHSVVSNTGASRIQSIRAASGGKLF